MREIGVGIRIDPNEGLSFHGLEEVKALLNFGGVVTGIEAGGALMRKLGEGDGNVRLTLSGCELKVHVDDSAVEASPQWLEHQRLYAEGTSLIKPFMQLANTNAEEANNPASIERVEQGIAILQRVLELNPANWPASWMIGKAQQARGRTEAACEAFGKSFGLNKNNPDVAREYMLECLRLGKPKPAIGAARHALTLQPENPGLVANLALALLIGAELPEAASTAAQAAAMDPNDDISKNLQQMIGLVQSGRRPQPKCLGDLER